MPYCEHCNKNIKGDISKHKEYCKRIEGINIQKLFNSGMTITGIAKQFNVTRKFLSKIIKQEEYICVLCNHKFDKRNNYLKHMKMNCNGKGIKEEQEKIGSVSCEKCGYVFNNRENYNRHIKACNGIGPKETLRPGIQICIYCNKKFNNIENYRRHIKWCEKIKDIDLQKEYSSGLSCSQIAEKYNISEIFVTKNIKEKRSRIQAYNLRVEQEPEKFFFKGTRRVSRGEKVFEELLKENKLYNNFNIIRQYHIFNYRLDFAFPEIKLDVEIDGMQHYIKKDIIKRDNKRNNLLIENGWTIYRIASKDFLMRPKVVFKKFLEFLEKDYQDNKLHKYKGQLIDGDKKFTKDRISLILNSNINFKEKGWSVLLGQKLNISACSALRWVKTNMPEFYKNNCRTPRLDFKNKTNGCS